MGWTYRIPDYDKYSFDEYLERYKKSAATRNLDDYYLKLGWDLRSCLKKFLNNPEIQELVKENDWPRIFYLWYTDYEKRREAERYGNGPGWPVCRLSDALFLGNSGIDFWNYLPDDFDPYRYFLEDRLIWEDN